jgi:hypothetical protein
MWEALRAEQVGDPNTYRLKSVPFYAKEIAYEDEVRTTISPEGYFPVFERVTKRSGFSTVRLWLEENEDKSAIVDFFTARGCLLEFELNNRLVALAIPERSSKLCPTTFVSRRIVDAGMRKMDISFWMNKRLSPLQQ